MHLQAQNSITTLTRGPRDSVRLAAIDVGSNSVHMVIAQADADGGVTTLWRMKEMVGLGRISFPSKKLSREAVDRAIAALTRFQQAAQQRQCEKIIAVATSAVREAENGGDFILRIKSQLGLYVRVISAREEARLIYLAVRHAIELGDKQTLIIDIGGGSVEFVVGDSHKANLLESRKLGAARMTAKFIHSDPASQADLQKLRAHYAEMLDPLAAQISQHRPARTIGTSGTLEALAAMSGDSEASQIDRPAFEEMFSQLIKHDAKHRAQMRGLDDQRRDQILAGAVLVDELFGRLNIKRIQISQAALREGILLDYLSRHVPQMKIRREVPDPRRRSVLDLARRCDWNRTHSEHVAKICLELFDGLRSIHGLGAIERELIEYASLLHDIGWHIGRRGHHKHSMYLIANGDLKGFSSEEVKVIASIARYHRKATPKKSHKFYGELSSWGRRVVDVGAAMLRLSDGLDRSHASAVNSVSCRIDEDRVKCLLHARSDAELELWGARRKMDFAAKVFGRKFKFELTKR